MLSSGSELPPLLEIVKQLIEDVDVYKTEDLEAYEVPGPFANHEGIGRKRAMAQVHVVGVEQVIDRSDGEHDDIAQNEGIEPAARTYRALFGKEEVQGIDHDRSVSEIVINDVIETLAIGEFGGEQGMYTARHAEEEEKFVDILVEAQQEPHQCKARNVAHVQWQGMAFRPAVIGDIEVLDVDFAQYEQDKYRIVDKAHFRRRFFFDCKEEYSK